tara:strand:- start:51 stop:158 length:108 start_codon:yes stop_codon:yes gene_type:complete
MYGHIELAGSIVGVLGIAEFNFPPALIVIIPPPAG